MNLNSLKFDPDDDSGTPIAATVTLTMPEAAMFTKFLGCMNDPAAKEFFANNPVLAEEYVFGDTYSDFTHYIFNRFWDDGVDEYVKGMKR